MFQAYHFLKLAGSSLIRPKGLYFFNYRISSNYGFFDRQLSFGHSSYLDPES